MRYVIKIVSIDDWTSWGTETIGITTDYFDLAPTFTKSQATDMLSLWRDIHGVKLAELTGARCSSIADYVNDMMLV